MTKHKMELTLRCWNNLLARKYGFDLLYVLL